MFIYHVELDGTIKGFQVLKGIVIATGRNEAIELLVKTVLNPACPVDRSSFKPNSDAYVSKLGVVTQECNDLHGYSSVQMWKFL